jgi:cardiolipin synthase
VWIGHAQSPKYWRETQYELHGPVVGQLQDNFNDNWEELRGCRLSGPDYYPPLLPTGTQAAQMVLGSPEKMEDTLGSSMLLAIRSARRSIHIAHAYFLPCREFTEALVEAMHRGVHIEIMVPGPHTDAPVVRSTTIRTLRRLIAAGAELYEFQPTMMHGKLMVIDGHLTVADTVMRTSTASINCSKLPSATTAMKSKARRLGPWSAWKANLRAVSSPPP